MFLNIGCEKDILEGRKEEGGGRREGKRREGEAGRKREGVNERDNSSITLFEINTPDSPVGSCSHGPGNRVHIATWGLQSRYLH